MVVNEGEGLRLEKLRGLYYRVFCLGNYGFRCLGAFYFLAVLEIGMDLSCW
jgi:hypothetical protein